MTSPNRASSLEAAVLDARSGGATVRMPGVRRVAADARRDAKLARWGYRVLRLENELVRRDVQAAVERIRVAIEK
jgi:hypothetical protein